MQICNTPHDVQLNDLIDNFVTIKHLCFRYILIPPKLQLHQFPIMHYCLFTTTLLRSYNNDVLPDENANIKAQNPAKNDLVQPWQNATESI